MKDLTMNAMSRPIELIRPHRIDFGSGVASNAGQWVRDEGFKRVLVVADSFNASRIDRLGLVGAVTVFADIKPEPDIANLQAVLTAAETAGADVVIGFGGGSAMDLAKLAAVLPGSGQSIADVVGAEKVAAKRAE